MFYKKNGAQGVTKLRFRARLKWNCLEYRKVKKLSVLLQKSCIDFTIEARPLERYMPSKRTSFKYKVWRIVVSTPFEYFIMTLIVLNTLLLMMKVCLFIILSVLEINNII